MNLILPDVKVKIESALDILIQKFLDDTVVTAQIPEFPLLFSEFASRKGKRIRSLIFTLTFLSGKGTEPEFLYHTAASIELLHLFALIHDDVVDRSVTRRGVQSLHKAIEQFYKIEPYQGQNLAIIIGDSLYSYSIDNFMKVKENEFCKQRALKAILDAATKTGYGQFLELLCSQKPLGNLSQDEIYAIYDYKTAMYTFCGPLTAGARLAGMSDSDIDKLYQAGRFLGRAYQIQDDLDETIEALSSNIVPSDFCENRKTILLWHLYKNSTNEIRSIIDSNKCRIFKAGELKRLLKSTATYDFVYNELKVQLDKAFEALKGIKLTDSVSDNLNTFLNSLFPLYAINLK